MTITGAIVLFSVIWFLALFIALPIGEKSQSEDGNVVPGTPASAPIDPMLRKKLLWVTITTIVLWAALVLVIRSGVISIQTFDVFGIMTPNE